MSWWGVLCGGLAFGTWMTLCDVFQLPLGFALVGGFWVLFVNGWIWWKP